MKWREVGGPQQQSDGDKPTLAAVLDHYDAHYYPSRRSQMTRCLLHEDRTPSLSIDLNKNVWNCHSCGQGGDAYALLMLKEGITFGGARELAATLGLATGDAGGSDSGVRSGSYTSRRAVPGGKGNRPSSGGYKPSWRSR